MDRQAIFDRVASHLLAQGEKSELHDTCRYRAPSRVGRDLSCAIGVLIPAALYDPEMEGKTVAGLLREWPAVAKALDADSVGPDVAFLNRLQQIHDNHTPNEWPEHLRNFAFQHKLSPSVLDA